MLARLTFICLALLAAACSTLSPGAAAVRSPSRAASGAQAGARAIEGDRVATCDRHLDLSLGGATLVVPYCGNLAVDGPDAAVRRAIVVIHGTNRNADDYFQYVRAAAEDAGVADATLVIAPWFLTEGQLDEHGLDPNGLFWSQEGWKQGDDSLSTSGHPRPATISSFAVVDALVRQLVTGGAFPGLREIVVTGHSAGGQFTQHFAASSQVEQEAGAAGVSMRYVVANPSSYLYFSRERPTGSALDQFTVPDARAVATCPAFGQYKYGLDRLNGYAQQVGPERIPQQYALRQVVYLLGSADVDPRDPSLERSCPAMFQGRQRFERGTVYYNYLGYRFGPSVYERHVREIVPGVAHDARAMYSSPIAWRHLFGAEALATAGEPSAPVDPAPPARPSSRPRRAV